MEDFYEGYAKKRAEKSIERRDKNPGRGYHLNMWLPLALGNVLKALQRAHNHAYMTEEVRDAITEYCTNHAREVLMRVEPGGVYLRVHAVVTDPKPYLEAKTHIVIPTGKMNEQDQPLFWVINPEPVVISSRYGVDEECIYCYHVDCEGRKPGEPAGDKCPKRVCGNCAKETGFQDEYHVKCTEGYPCLEKGDYSHWRPRNIQIPEAKEKT